MSQRDTILPVCRLVTVASGITANVNLCNTGIHVAALNATGQTITGVPDGLTDVTISGCYVSGGGDESGGLGSPGHLAGVSAVATVEGRNATDIRNGVASGTIKTDSGFITIKTAGSYGSADVSAGGLVLDLAGTLGAAGKVQATLSEQYPSVPYVSVTQVSGSPTQGWYRVIPGSGTNLYTTLDSDMNTPRQVFASSVQANNGLTVGTAAAGDPGDRISNNTSGLAGVIGGAGQTVTITLQPHQRINSIIIENNLKFSEYALDGAEAVFAVNYGVIQQASPLRDNNLDTAF